MDGATPVGIRLRRSIPEHDAYTVYLADHRFAVLATARPSDARRWVATTRWLHPLLLYHGRLVVGLGVQWTPTRRPLGGAPPLPATLQLCVGHRCLVFHLAQADAVPEALRRFLADPRVTFVGAGSANDRRMLWAHFGLRVACGRELRAMAGMGNASMEEMADRILGYPGVSKCREVAMSAWHAPRLSMDQVEYAAVDAFLAFRLGVRLCPGGAAGRHPVPARAAPPAHVRPPGPVPVRQAPPANRTIVLTNGVRPAPPPRTPVPARPARPVNRSLVFVRIPHPQAPPAACAPGINHAMPRVEGSPPAFSGAAWAAAGTDAANSSSNGSDTSAGLTGSDTDATDYVGDTDTHGLPIRAYASDSEDEDYSSDGFEHVRFGAFTDEEEEVDVDEDDQEDEGGNTVCSGLGKLGVDDNEEGYEEYGEIGILTADCNGDYGPEEFTGDGVVSAIVDEEDGGGSAFEYLGHSEAVLDDDEDVIGQDDWFEQEDYGSDLDDEDELEFCLL